jgi:hypothetical protein
MHYKEIDKCRICGGKLRVVYTLGNLYISTFLKDKDKAKMAPLRLATCIKCELVQLKDEVILDNMYRQYWYRSGLNKSMVKDLKDIVDSAKGLVEFKSGDVVTDIGTNDGTLLSLYMGTEILVKVGFDPAYNLANVANENCNYFINDYFTFENYPETLPKSKVVTAIAMFYDLPNPYKFVQDVESILHEDGIFIIQFTDYISILKNTMVDSICHEHLEYYTFVHIVKIMKDNGLKVIDVEENDVNGGSIRVYIVHEKSKVQSTERVPLKLANDALFLSTARGTIEYFKNSVRLYKESVGSYLDKAVERGGTIYALAASTKGNTLLQVFNLHQIQAVGDINEDKFGLRTVTGIPIISEKEVLDLNPDIIVVLAWHFTDTFEKVLEEYVDNGGIVVYPLPYPLAVTDRREVSLVWAK